MTWHRWGQFKEGPQNLHELHVSNVYQDDDFIDDVKAIFPNRNQLLKLRRNSRDYSTIDRQIPEACESIDDFERERLAKKYSITIGDISWYLRGNSERTGEFYRKIRKPFKAVSTDEDSITIEYQRDITKEDYLEAWNQWIIPLKGKASQQKLPVHDKLLYAVFKAREQRGESFKQIFEQYETGKLPGYNGPNSMFASNQKKFEEYYRRYKIT